MRGFRDRGFLIGDSLNLIESVQTRRASTSTQAKLQPENEPEHRRNEGRQPKWAPGGLQGASGRHVCRRGGPNGSWGGQRLSWNLRGSGGGRTGGFEKNNWNISSLSLACHLFIMFCSCLSFTISFSNTYNPTVSLQTRYTHVVACTNRVVHTWLGSRRVAAIKAKSGLRKYVNLPLDPHVFCLGQFWRLPFVSAIYDGSRLVGRAFTLMACLAKKLEGPERTSHDGPAVLVIRPVPAHGTDDCGPGTARGDPQQSSRTEMRGTASGSRWTPPGRSE